MTRIDLDDLVAKARAAAGVPQAASATSRVVSRPHRDGLFDVLTETDGAEIYQPSVVLALVERIRSLERGLGALVAECEERTENPGGDFYSEQRYLVEQGVVLS